MERALQGRPFFLLASESFLADIPLIEESRSTDSEGGFVRIRVWIGGINQISNSQSLVLIPISCKQSFFHMSCWACLTFLKMFIGNHPQAARDRAGKEAQRKVACRWQ